MRLQGKKSPDHWGGIRHSHGRDGSRQYRRGRRPTSCRAWADRQPHQQRAVFTAAPIIEVTRAGHARVFGIDLAGPLVTLQAVARHMMVQGIQGQILNMASQAGRRRQPLVAVSCATKAAIISLTQSAGLTLIRHGIKRNATSPDVVDGEHWDGVDASFADLEGKTPGQKKAEVGAAVPFGRMGTADDLTGRADFWPVRRPAIWSRKPTIWMADNG